MFSRLSSTARHTAVAAVRSTARAGGHSARRGLHLHRLSTLSKVTPLAPRQAIMRASSSSVRPSATMMAKTSLRRISTHTKAVRGRNHYWRWHDKRYHRHMRDHYGRYGHCMGPWGLVKKVVAGVVITGVAIMVLSTGATVLLTVAVVAGVSMLFIRFMPMRHPALHMMKEAMMASAAMRESARVAKRGWKIVASQARTDITTVLKDHSKVRNLFVNKKVSKLRLLNMKPLEGAVTDGATVAHGPVQISAMARIKHRPAFHKEAPKPATVHVVANVTLPSPEESAQMMEERTRVLFERTFSDAPPTKEELWNWMGSQTPVDIVNLTWQPMLGEPIVLVENGMTTDPMSDTPSSGVVEAEFRDT